MSGNHRKELAWTTMAMMLLLGALSWFFVSMITEMKDQNVAQWRLAGQNKDCMMEHIAKLRERVALIEGAHSKEKK